MSSPATRICGRSGRCSTTSTALTDERGLFEHALHATPAAGARLLRRRRRAGSGRHLPGAAIPVRWCSACTTATCPSCSPRLSRRRDLPQPDGHRRRVGPTSPDSVTGGVGPCGVWVSRRRCRRRPASGPGRWPDSGWPPSNVRRTPRAAAFAALGAGELSARAPRSRRRWRCWAMPLAPSVGSRRAVHWPWPEPRLSYANATLAEALMVAGEALADEVVLARGLELLTFLLRVEVRDDPPVRDARGRSGARRYGPRLRPAADRGRGDRRRLRDCAHRITADPRWLTGVDLAWRWFLGENDTVTVMFDPVTGGGYDGLERDGSQPQPGRGVHPWPCCQRRSRRDASSTSGERGSRAPHAGPSRARSVAGGRPAVPARRAGTPGALAGRRHRRPGARPRRGRGGAAGGARSPSGFGDTAPRPARRC